jgi:hypothetical protein
MCIRVDKQRGSFGVRLRLVRKPRLRVGVFLLPGTDNLLPPEACEGKAEGVGQLDAVYGSYNHVLLTQLFIASCDSEVRGYFS